MIAGKINTGEKNSVQYIHLFLEKYWYNFYWVQSGIWRVVQLGVYFKGTRERHPAVTYYNNHNWNEYFNSTRSVFNELI